MDLVHPQLAAFAAVLEEGSFDAAARRLSISPSALSQHLGRMREEGLVTYRRDAQTLYYRIDNDKVGKLITALKDIFCP